MVLFNVRAKCAVKAVRLGTGMTRSRVLGPQPSDPHGLYRRTATSSCRGCRVAQDWGLIHPRAIRVPPGEDNEGLALGSVLRQRPLTK